MLEGEAVGLAAVVLLSPVLGDQLYVKLPLPPLAVGLPPIVVKLPLQIVCGDPALAASVPLHTTLIVPSTASLEVSQVNHVDKLGRFMMLNEPA